MEDEHWFDILPKLVRNYRENIKVTDEKKIVHDCCYLTGASKGESEYKVFTKNPGTQKMNCVVQRPLQATHRDWRVFNFIFGQANRTGT